MTSATNPPLASETHSERPCCRVRTKVLADYHRTCNGRVVLPFPPARKHAPLALACSVHSSARRAHVHANSPSAHVLTSLCTLLLFFSDEC